MTRVEQGVVRFQLTSDIERDTVIASLAQHGIDAQIDPNSTDKFFVDGTQVLNTRMLLEGIGAPHVYEEPVQAFIDAADRTVGVGTGKGPGIGYRAPESPESGWYDLDRYARYRDLFLVLGFLIFDGAISAASLLWGIALFGIALMVVGYLLSK